MEEHELMALAAGPTLAVVRDISAERLDSPTPCADYDIGRLVNHLLFWGPSLKAAARKDAVAPPAASEQDVYLTHGDWKDRLVAQTNLLVAAWSEPGAWKGYTRLGGPMEMPAPMIGGMVLGELVVHGWDIAQAIGQQPTWDDEVPRPSGGGEDGRAGPRDGDLRRAGTSAGHSLRAGPATRTDRSRPELDALKAPAMMADQVSGCGRRPGSVARPVPG